MSIIELLSILNVWCDASRHGRVVTVVIYLPRDCGDNTSRLTQVSFTTYNTVDKLY